MTNWFEVRDEYERTDITLPDLADRHGLKHNTVKSRKSREGWKKVDSPEPTVRPVITKPVVEQVETEIVTQVKNKQPLKVKQTSIIARPRKDSPWLKFLPDEMVKVMETMENIDPLDILYDQIRIQWAIILRAQEIMFVSDQLDMDRFKTTSGMDSDSYEIHTAWDKHGKFMTQLSSAQKELRDLIKQFMTIAPVEDERRIRIRNMEANTELTEVRTRALKGAVKDTAMLDVLINAVAGGDK